MCYCEFGMPIVTHQLLNIPAWATSTLPPVFSNCLCCAPLCTTHQMGKFLFLLRSHWNFPPLSRQFTSVWSLEICFSILFHNTQTQNITYRYTWKIQYLTLKGLGKKHTHHNIYKAAQSLPPAKQTIQHSVRTFPCQRQATAGEPLLSTLEQSMTSARKCNKYVTQHPYFSNQD